MVFTILAGSSNSTTLFDKICPVYIKSKVSSGLEVHTFNKHPSDDQIIRQANFGDHGTSNIQWVVYMSV